MKNLLLIFIILLYSWMGHSQSAIEYDTMLCKLEYIQSIDSFALYYQTINLWEKEIIKSEKFDQLTNTEPFYNYLPKTEIDSFSLSEDSNSKENEGK